MKYADPKDVAALVTKIVGASPLAGKFNGVDVDASDFNNENDFLRILIHFKSLDDLSEADVDAITSSIEGAALSLDDRFPSVRFSEP